MPCCSTKLTLGTGHCTKCPIADENVGIFTWTSPSFEATEHAIIDDQELFIISHDWDESICDPHFQNYVESISKMHAKSLIIVVSWASIVSF